MGDGSIFQRRRCNQKDGFWYHELTGDAPACKRTARGIAEMSSPGSQDGVSSEELETRAEVADRIRELQNQLLDLSRRNRLLNFRSDKGFGSLRIVDEVPAEVFRIVVVEGKSMQFLAREEAPAELAATLGADDSAEGTIGVALPPLEGGAQAERHRDAFLQTLLEGEKLQTRLTRLAQQAGSSLDEQGTNILYLALGVVTWRETPGSDVVSNAPLLLIPVELTRRTVGSRHQLRISDDDVVANPTLIELGKRLFNVTIPAPNLDDAFDLTSYFQAVGGAVAPLRWQVAEEIHLGLFSFSKLLMYQDLEAGGWRDDAHLVDHPLRAAAPRHRRGEQHRRHDGSSARSIGTRRRVRSDRRTSSDGRGLQPAGCDCRDPRGRQRRHRGPPRHRQVADDYQHHRRVSCAGPPGPVRRRKGSSVGRRRTPAAWSGPRRFRSRATQPQDQ